MFWRKKKGSGPTPPDHRPVGTPDGKPDAKADGKPGGKPDAKVDGTRRAMLRMFVNPVASIVSGTYKEPENPGVYFKPNPPGTRKVLKGGAQADFLALLGPYARGVQVPGGFRLFGVQIREDVAEVNFMRPNELVQLVFANLSTGQPGEGIEAGSFRIRTSGNAPSQAIHEVATTVASEVRGRDTGALWMEVSIPPPKPPEAPPGTPAK